MIRYIEVLNEYDAKGTYTYRIRWDLEDCINGYILQYVKIEDALHILKNYDMPYYEAWEVKDGKVVYNKDVYRNTYDDEFSNELGGLVRNSMQEDVQELMADMKCDECFISYRCKVYFIAEGSDVYDEIKLWDRGTVSMAGDLIRSNYELRNRPGMEEFTRENHWKFIRT